LFESALYIFEVLRIFDVIAEVPEKEITLVYFILFRLFFRFRANSFVDFSQILHS